MSSIHHLALLFFTIFTCHAQERYIDSLFSLIAVETYTYSDTLQLDFYSAEKDTVKNKPLLILVHGGGFAIGKRDNPLEQNFSKEMAMRGYAVASISYRLLRKGKSFGCDCPAKKKMETFLAASEDILKATGFLSKKAKELGLDINRIVLIGSSAGAEAVLNTVFMRNHHDFKSLPDIGLKFAGVVSFAGAVVDSDYIVAENAVPTLLFHGEKDNLVPFGTAPHHYCRPDSKGYLILKGSASIAKRLAELDISYQLILDPEGNHDWANLPFSKAGMVADFIVRTIIRGELIQSKVKISR